MGLLNFGRLDSDHHIHNVTINIGALTRVFDSTFDVLEDLSVANVPIARNDFIRMCRTLVLKRAMDVQDQEKGVRPPHFLRLPSKFLVPRPVADLLYSLGQHKSPANGVVYDILAPAQLGIPQPWYAVDPQIVADFTTWIHRNQKYYQMCEIPPRTQKEGTPLVLTNSNEAGGENQVKAGVNNPQISDALLRCVHENAMFQNPPFAYANCHLQMTERLDMAYVLTTYVNSYNLGNN